MDWQNSRHSTSTQNDDRMMIGSTQTAPLGTVFAYPSTLHRESFIEFQFWIRISTLKSIRVRLVWAV